MAEKRREDFLWLSLLTLVYLFFWVPVLNVYPNLSPGDHGRDFYAFWMTFQGGRPCRDYFWQYGPVMPFYYAFWFLVGGVNLVSVRVGLAFNYFFCSFFAYRALRYFTSGFIAFLSSLAFLSYDLTWTYNHLGAIPFLLLSVSCLWKFLMTHESRWCYGMLFSVVGWALVKINVGVISFIALYASLLLYNAFFLWKHLEAPLKAKHFVFLPLLFGTVVLGVYGILHFGFSLSEIVGCMNLAPKHHHRSPLGVNLKHLILYFFVWHPVRRVGIGLFLMLAILAVLGLKKKGLERETVVLYSFVVISLVLLGFAVSAEYFVIHSIISRFDFWLFPILVLIAGFCAEGASFLLSTKMKFFLGALLLFPLLLLPYQNLKHLLTLRSPERYLAVPNGKAYVGGNLSDVEVIQKGSRFIVDHTKPHEAILAVPYDPLYCFLSGRRHIVPEQLFSQVIHPAEDREEQLIHQLEVKQVPYVILSNRYTWKEPGFGRFGKTHSQKLAKYIFEHYEETQSFGPWDPPSPRLHAIKILQRKNAI